MIFLEISDNTRDVLEVLFGSGSVVGVFAVAYFGYKGAMERREKVKAGTTTKPEEVETAKALEVAREMGLLDHWESYAGVLTQQNELLRTQNAELAEQNEMLRKRNSEDAMQRLLSYSYINELRTHINHHLPPPPPPWPGQLRDATLPHPD